MGATWVIVESRSIVTTERGLRQAGYRVYVPWYRKVMWPKGHNRKPASIMAPLFGHVGFVCDWRGWPAHTVPGEPRLMRGPQGAHARLTDADVALIREREHAGEFDEISYVAGIGRVVRTDIAPGDVVEIDVAGRSVLAVLEDLSEPGKAIVRALILGREVPWTVDQDELRVVRG